MTEVLTPGALGNVVYCFQEICCACGYRNQNRIYALHVCGREGKVSVQQNLSASASSLCNPDHNPCLPKWDWAETHIADHEQREQLSAPSKLPSVPAGGCTASPLSSPHLRTTANCQRMQHPSLSSARQRGLNQELFFFLPPSFSFKYDYKNCHPGLD